MKTQKQCDKLLTPIIKLQHPYCLLCGSQTQVAHHHVHKSKSLILRYDFDNLIPLCNSCHFKLHLDESYWGSKVTEIKGMKWFKSLDKRKDKLCVGKDKMDYDVVYARLKKILDDLSTSW